MGVVKEDKCIVNLGGCNSGIGQAVKVIMLSDGNYMIFPQGLTLAKTLEVVQGAKRTCIDRIHRNKKLNSDLRRQIEGIDEFCEVIEELVRNKGDV